MRVIIAGSRKLNPTESYIDLHIKQLVDVDSITSILCGMCRGVDTAGERWAKSKGIPVEYYPAEWTYHGTAADPKRNAEMVKNADALLVIRKSDSKGSSNVLSLAKRAGLKVRDVVVD